MFAALNQCLKNKSAIYLLNNFCIVSISLYINFQCCWLIYSVSRAGKVLLRQPTTNRLRLLCCPGQPLARINKFPGVKWWVLRRGVSGGHADSAHLSSSRRLAAPPQCNQGVKVEPRSAVCAQFFQLGVDRRRRSTCPNVGAKVSIIRAHRNGCKIKLSEQIATTQAEIKIQSLKGLGVSAVLSTN